MDSFFEILKRAWKNLKTRYFMNIMVVFLVGVIVSGYAFSSNGNNNTVGRSIGSDSASIIEDLLNGQQLFNINTTP